MFKKFFTFSKQIKQHKVFTAETINSRKYYKQWSKTLDHSKTSLDYGLPWFTFQAIEYIENKLLPNAKVFEYGGGGSTVFFMKKNCEVYTVEHDAAWFKNIELFFDKNKNAFRWNGFLLEAASGEIIAHPQKNDPLHYSSDDEKYKGMNFKNYASKIEDYKDEFFDLVLVDGRARPSCVYHAINKIKKEGLLVLDNTERAYYSENFKAVLAERFVVEVDVFGPVPYIDWFHKTTVWKKIK